MVGGSATDILGGHLILHTGIEVVITAIQHELFDLSIGHTGASRIFFDILLHDGFLFFGGYGLAE